MKAFRRHISPSHLLLLSAALAIALLFTACASTSKFLADGEKILSNNKFDITTTDNTEPTPEISEALSDMKKFIKQKPNSHLLGFGPRVTMRIYCLSNPEKNNFWHNYLRRKGQAPVIFNPTAARQTCNQIEGLLASKGCFHSSVTYDTVLNGNDVSVTYHIAASQRYRVDDLLFHAETPEVNKLLDEWRDESLLHYGSFYDQDILNSERSRVIERLRNEGFYRASTDLVSYIIDTAFDDHKLSIRLNIANPRIVNSDRQTVTVPLQKYRIDDILIFPNSTAASNTGDISFDTTVTTMEFRNNTSRYIYLHNQPMTLKPRTINRSLLLFHNQTYRPRNIERTYNSLLNLRNFKYISIDFVESPNSTDTNRLLNARVRLLNAKRQRLSASVELNNSSPFGEQNQGLLSGNFGLETKLSYQNKNLFGGAEIFKTEWSLLIELPKLILKDHENEFLSNFSNFENGLTFSLDLPSFLFPFNEKIPWQRMRPHTVISCGTNYQMHSYFERLLLNTAFGYSWHRNRNSHQLLPLELTYVRFFNIDTAFRNRINAISDARVKYQYSDHFIMDARYDYIYNSQQFGQRHNFNYFHFSVESAGALLNAIGLLSDMATDENGIRQVFGVPYSQYVRLNNEFKRYFYIGEKSTFVARLMLGIGLPYNNMAVMPYEKSFFGGGPTTIRAWHLRRLGPGAFSSESSALLDRTGDIQIVANLEYRFPIFSVFEGAIFADMGNVWLANESSEFPGGKFKINSFYKEIATGIGFGLRANISIVTLRCDLSIPLVDPGATAGSRWCPPHWSLSQVTANFGIDYPF